MCRLFCSTLKSPAIGCCITACQSKIGRKADNPVGRCHASDEHLYLTTRMHGAGRYGCSGGDCEQDDSIEDAFNRYRDARYLRTARIQFTSRELGKLYHACGVHRELQNSLLSGAGATALADTLNWLWGSPLSVPREGYGLPRKAMSVIHRCAPQHLMGVISLQSPERHNGSAPPPFSFSAPSSGRADKVRANPPILRSSTLMP